MKYRKKYFLKEAIVLVIATVMVLSAIPAVSAGSEEINKAGGSNSIVLKNPYQPDDDETYQKCRPRPVKTPNMGGVGSPTYITYSDGNTENSFRWSSLGDMTFAIELTDIELTGYRNGYCIDEVVVSIGCDDFGFDLNVPYDVYIGTSLPNPGVSPIITSGVSNQNTDWTTITIPTPYAIPSTGNVFVGLTYSGYPGTSFPLGVDTSFTGPDRAAHLLDPSTSTWGTISSVTGGQITGIHGIEVGVSPCGGPIPDTCLPDQCDFELVSINNIEDQINSFPKDINITIRNNGAVGIPELKLLADVYEKVCGPTTEICCDNVYDLCDWEDETAADWTVKDDGDGDSFVLQGGSDNRWATNDQAWRNTMGEDRSFGGDEDVYLGLAADAVGYDELIWHCNDTNDVSGAACAEFSFQHWCEGEYGLIGGDLYPVDYGTLSYSLDDGATWTDIPISDFVAYDTDGNWEEVVIKFINTNVYSDTTYADVCEDCDADEGDIVISEDFPSTAKLQVNFTWQKDPCDQFEGWYIDDVCLKRTEMYELRLVHQTHEIIELPPCVGAPENMYYEFPLGWDPEPDKWYQIDICGQVFDCPDCCEQIFDNNCKSMQFEVTDIHDMQCEGISLVMPPSLSQPLYNEGDPIVVNMTVRNVGTFAESNVPVDLKVGKRVLDRRIDETFETNPTGWDRVYFVGGDLTNHFRWTAGDDTIDNIGPRSILPGNEAIICADEGFLYPRVPEGTAMGITTGDVYDFSDVEEATLEYYARFSLPLSEDCDSDGFTDTFWGVFFHPTEGPDSASWSGSGLSGFDNEYAHYTHNLKTIQEDYAYGDGILPPIEFAICVFVCANDGETVNPANPIPWSGVMFDNIKLDVISCGATEVVDTQYTGALVPDETENIFLTWDSAELCNWCLCGDINLEDDIDESNDVCCVSAKVQETLEIEDFNSEDLTGGGDCLWHICSTRICQGSSCAWAGIEEAQHGHYVNNMDDSFVSPVQNLSAYDVEGVKLNITTWYQFADTDFGELYIRYNSTQPWVKLDTFTASSGGFHTTLSYFIDPMYCTDEFQVKFRMVSNEEGYDEGWYICEVCLVELISSSSSTTDVLDEDFEGGFIPTGWVEDPTSSEWEVGTSSVGSGSYSAYVWWTYAAQDELLMTPKLDLSSGKAEVSFLSTFMGANDAGFQWVEHDYLMISTDDGNTWTTIADMPYDYPNAVSAIWGTYTFDLSPYIGPGDTDVRIGFHRVTPDGGSAVWGIDNVVVERDDSAFVYGDEIWCDYFDRLNIAPWQCVPTVAGDYWDTSILCIHGYPSDGKGLNDAMYTQLDLTNPDLTYAELFFMTAWDMEDGCHAYIEFSPDWDGASPMETAVWVPYWQEEGPSQQLTFISSEDLVEDDRFVINEYLGDTVYVRFRYTTPGEGFPAIPGAWCLDDVLLIYKEEEISTVDNEPPITNIAFDSQTGKVTLLAQDYPIGKGSGVKATFYKIDTGDFETYTGPFTIPEGTHTVFYYSEDNADNKETTKSQQYTVDTTPPTVEIISPEEGKLYLFGSPIMNRIFSDITLCIGKVPIEATADDAGGSGINKVLFSYNNETSWDDESPYEDVFKGRHFGNLTITVTALDNVGLESNPAEMTIKVYCLGLF